MSVENQKKIYRNDNSSLKINDDSVERLKQLLGWQGSGAAGDPIVVDNLEGQKPCVQIDASDLHYEVRGLSVYKLRLFKAHNVTIDGCKISIVEIEGSRDVQVRNS